MKEIPLTKGYVALCDDEDYERLMRYKWHAQVTPSGCVYARTSVRGPDGKQRKVLMHVMLMGFPSKGVSVNHIDGDGRNNQKLNLELSNAKLQQHAFRRKPKGASSKFRGVTWHKGCSKWHAQIRQAGKLFHIGLFESEEAAARVRDAKAMELFGSNAQFNFPI